MIDAILFLALGFLVATLLGLMVLPAIARRADRLARRRAEAAFPLSLEQVAAERDHLRAELALRERAAEKRAEEAEGVRVTAMRLAGERDVANAALQRDLAARAADIVRLEAALADMTADRDAQAARLALERRAHGETGEALEKARADITRLDGTLNERQEEIGLLNRARQALEQDLAGLQAVKTSLDVRLESLAATIDSLRAETDRLKSALVDEEQARAALATAKAELETAFMARGQELDDERRRALDHAAERDKARLDLVDARRQEAETRRALEDAARQMELAGNEAARNAQRLADRIATLEARLAEMGEKRAAAEKTVVSLRAERAQLRQDMAGLRREVATLEAAAKAEMAALRREISAAAEALLASRAPMRAEARPRPAARARRTAAG